MWKCSCLSKSAWFTAVEVVCLILHITYESVSPGTMGSIVPHSMCPSGFVTLIHDILVRYEDEMGLFGRNTFEWFFRVEVVPRVQMGQAI